MKPLATVFGCIVALLSVAGCSRGAERTVSPVHWDLSAIIEPSTLRIAGFIGSSSCSAFDSYKVIEDDERVDITVLASTRKADACTADMQMKTIDVVLAAPLGDRELTGCLPFEAQPGQPARGCRSIVPQP